MFLKDFSNVLFVTYPLCSSHLFFIVFFFFLLTKVLLDCSLALTIKYIPMSVLSTCGMEGKLFVLFLNKRDSYLFLWYDMMEMGAFTVVLCIVQQVAVWL